MLVGRDAETGRIDALLSDARAGHGGALLVRGEPGIGKTVVLREARAAARGMVVLEAAGVQDEAELPYAGLTALARPLLHLVDELPAPQRDALGAALALGGRAGDRLAAAAGTLSLLSAAGEHAPVLVLVDDAHWLDLSTRDALLFAARRLRDDRVAILLASRDGEPGSLDGAGLPELVLSPLEESDARQLLVAGPKTSAEVAEHVLGAARGNPLALVEIPAGLSPEQRAGREPLEDPLFAGSIERAFAARGARLSTTGRLALAVACAEGTGEERRISAALTSLGLPPDALDEVAAAGLVTLGPRVDLRHPLVRSAMLHATEPGELRRVHAALAAAYAEPAEADRRAWHLAEAAMAPDESAAAALEAAADRASRRAGHAAAVRALERAAALSAAGPDAVRRLVAAARAAELAGLAQRAAALAEEAAHAATDPLLELEAVRIRARTEARTNPGAAVAALERVAAAAPAGARADALLDAALIGLGVDVELAARLAGSAAEAARAAGQDPEAAELVHARARHLLGDPTPAANVLPRVATSELERATLTIFLLAAMPVVQQETIRLSTEIVDLARERSALGVLPEALSTRAGSLFYTGDWDAAIADATEALELALAVGQPAVATDAHALLARLAAFRGFERECRAHVDAFVSLARRHGLDHNFAAVLLGELLLGQGDLEAALPQFERASMSRTISRARATLVEVYARLGREPEARASLADLERLVEGSESASGRLFESRLRGLLASDDELDTRFEEALERADELAWPLETARTELLYGERLRRARRRVDARAHLRRAIEIFDRLGARPWAERARRELAATGEHVRRRDAAVADELTPQESRIAGVVASGATNKEAAAALFVSPKTIEAHLGSIYRKLGIRSRTELAARFAGEREAAPA